MDAGERSVRRAALHDQVLDRIARELLTYDRRLAGARVRVRFDGGVAHVTGDVHDAATLATVRERLGELAGVYGVWDRVRVAGRAPVVVDLGCGDTKQYADSIGIDRRAAKAVDLVADIRYGLPLATSSVDRVFAVHVLEHLIDFLPVVDECHRVLRPGGVLHVLSPWWRHVNAVADPTHVRLFDVQTVKGICSRPGADRRWYPLHVGCDGATVFADLTPVSDRRPAADAERLARFFD